MALKSHFLTKLRSYDGLSLFILAVVYIAGLGTKPAFGDATSFTLGALRGADLATNATSHLAYGLVLHVMQFLVPAKDVLWLFPLFSTICTLGALWLLQKILQLQGYAAFIRFIVVLTIGLGFAIWRHAETTEVYAFNLLFCSSFLYCWQRWQVGGNGQFVLWGALILGIACLVHIQNILWIPALCYWLWLVYRRQPQTKWLIMGFLAFATPFALLFLLPAIHQEHGFSAIFFDLQFQDEVLSAKPAVLVKGFGLSLVFALLNFGLASVLVVWGMLKDLQKSSAGIMYWLLFLPVYGFAARYPVTDSYVFFIPAYLVAALWLAKGLLRVVNKAKTQWLWLLLPLHLPLAYGAATILGQLHPKGQEWQANKYYKGGLRFFTWPPMRGNPGTLELIEEVQKKKISLDANTEIQPNYQKAKVLKKIIEQKDDPSN